MRPCNQAEKASFHIAQIDRTFAHPGAGGVAQNVFMVARHTPPRRTGTRSKRDRLKHAIGKAGILQNRQMCLRDLSRRTCCCRFAAQLRLKLGQCAAQHCLFVRGIVCYFVDLRFDSAKLMHPTRGQTGRSRNADDPAS
ncbi:MAG: hypothetical protein CVT77_07130 [Alphaproteobacteria bacterium HGW-Alphaproteobacteria-16]|nr:MAG: hypothetical protein CVT77_07130 [Alphaproteobacteria bacterium HGW-Alphaproteobacteria-16]